MLVCHSIPRFVSQYAAMGCQLDLKIVMTDTMMNTDVKTPASGLEKVGDAMVVSPHLLTEVKGSQAFANLSAEMGLQ